MPQPIVELERVEKVYHGAHSGVAALRDVSWSIDPGDFVALMGPSGCGKSTLLHVIGAMDRVTSGIVRVDGRNLSQLDDTELTLLRRRQVGFVFQFFNLLPTMTVAENIALPLLMDGEPRSQALACARKLADRVGLTARLRHYPAELSGGEMQRAAVARAVVHRPRLVLADEPTGSLDSENGRQVLTLITELNRELDVTILLATHDHDVAKATNQQVTMRDGRLQLPSPNAS